MRERLAALAAIAVASAIAWRVELELTTGWASLAWAKRFHWAVPCGVAAFIAWAVWASRAVRPWRLLASLVLFAGVMIPLVEYGLWFTFVSGPMGMAMRALDDLPPALLWLEPLPMVFAWALIPFVFCGLCRWCGARVRPEHALLSALFFTLSWPLAVAIRPLLETVGAADMIHALKSGFVIPFLVISLGLPLLPDSDARLEAGRGKIG